MHLQDLLWRALAAAGALAICVGCGPRLLRIAYQPMDVEAARPKPPPQPEPPKQIYIQDRVEFEVDSAKLLAVSHKVLDTVVDVMKKNPDLKLVEVQGHTDASGRAEKNQTLSQKRAESVLNYMVKTGGIAAGRLRAKGYGQDKPIADNDTPEGKQKNRRVEFHIIERATPGAASK
jgi:OOP family OmpA-OmpF porin